MTMRYFQHGGATFGYDGADPAQAGLIETAVAGSWTEVTGSWPPAPPSPSLAQQAATLLAGGLAVTCTSDAALSATYPADQTSQTKMIGLQLGLTATGAFPGGATTWPVKDAATPPQWHVMTAVQFGELVTKMLAFVAACDLVIDGQSTTLPPPTATIA